MNSCVFTGRLGETPELKKTGTMISVCNFSLAVERPKSQDAESTVDWLKFVAWDKRAEFVCRHLTKGRKVLVSATAQTRSYEDKNGSKHNVVEFRVDNVEFCDSKPVQEQAGTEQPSEEATGIEGMPGDDLPF